MRAHRLRRLQLLTQGVALLGLGGVETACHGEPPDTVHINAPYTPPDAGQAPVDRPHMNAPYVPPDAGVSAATANGGAPAQIATSASSQPPFIVPHMNATATPPKTVNAPPKTVNAPPKP